MAIEKIKVLLQHFLSVNFVVICGSKQPLQNCLSKASFMLFMFFKSTKWKHAYLLLPLLTRAVFAHAQSIFPLVWIKFSFSFKLILVPTAIFVGSLVKNQALV